ncbi:DUF3768 domain-containing protein [Roseobacter sp.]|uniref:DUF3768 domain-containing protein n=1 Tax=Roseobacter sp. TaxID=1907202 RepID=UPI00385D5A76
MQNTAEVPVDFRTALVDETPESIARFKLVGEQNDRFRNTWGADFTIPGQIVQTNGVAALSFAWQAKIMTTVMQFSEFTEDNDPYLKRDFGAFALTIDGKTEHFLWKVDLYDRDYRYGTDDDANPDVTRRVLTLMLSTDY